MHEGFRAVLFDFSATLFDPTGVVDGAAFVSRARRSGTDLDEANAGPLAARILAFADTPHGKRIRDGCDLSPQRHRRAWLELAVLVPGVNAALAAAFYDCVTDPARWLPYDDTPAVLAALRQAGMRIAVISNCGWDVREAFAHHGLAELVDEYVLSCEQGRVKPDPALFALACERLRVPPASAVMVGDDAYADAGAVGAGVATYLLAPPAAGRRTRGLATVVHLTGARDADPAR